MNSILWSVHPLDSRNEAIKVRDRCGRFWVAWNRLHFDPCATATSQFDSADRDRGDGRPRRHFFGKKPAQEKIHRYYIAAEPELWDYAPSSRDDICGTKLPSAVLNNRRRAKLRYIQYTDETFRTMVPPHAEPRHSGTGIARSGRGYARGHLL